MNGLIDFECEVYESGYEIVTLKEFMNEQFEVTSVVEYEYNKYIRLIDPTGPKRIFNLMENPGAYNEFSTLFTEYFYIFVSNENKDIRKDFNLDEYLIKFANKYGMLCNPSSPIKENTELWIGHMMKMFTAVHSFVSPKEEDSESLKNFFTRDGDKFRYRFHYVGMPLLITPANEIPTIGQTPPRNYSEAAYHYICYVANSALKNSLTTEIVVNKTNTGTDMIVRPKDLISALWLQVAQAVSRNLEFKQCEDCSTFFEVKSKKRRFEKIYCSDKCRKRVSARKRREKEKAK